MNRATPKAFRHLLYRNENSEIILLTHYFHIDFFSEENKILSVLQFKNSTKFSMIDDYNGYRDGGGIIQFRAPLKDLQKLIKLGYPRKQRRHLKTVQAICRKAFAISVRPFNGLLDDDKDLFTAGG